MSYHAGRHFLQIPGPTNVPDRVLRAIDRATIDHRGPEFGALGREVLAGMQAVFQTRSPVIIFPGSGTGAWEAALVNTLDPGARILMAETGQFATLWKNMAQRPRPRVHPGRLAPRRRCRGDSRTPAGRHHA
jgi:alanine-glyoxylate transaminase/serine-glyoxylate transaminase/serine-pyruvate transaminase